ncbi:MAG: NAD(+)/NADH kinase [Bacteroidales bacterium]|nr:NAD(+)/NADH kinase [Bacteroidales bacterium]
MKIAYYHTKPFPENYPGAESLLRRLGDGGVETYDINQGIREGTCMLLSFGGDGTFLSAVSLVAGTDIPVAGVNFGRMGFLSDIRPECLVDTVLEGRFQIEKRELLEVSSEGLPPSSGRFAVNEIAVHRTGPGMMGVAVEVDGLPLPTYWADGLLVSTSAGSTAYSLSVGGPVCMPELNAFIVTPIAPHNLNMRPLLVPSGSSIKITPEDGEDITLSVDNRNFNLRAGVPVRVARAPFGYGRVKAEGSNFIKALEEKLFWGEDLRNRHK